jgi:hypothetical protein
VKQPTDQEVKDLTNAVWNSFGGCSCHATHRGPVTCPGHLFITEVDKRSVDIPRWQRLLFVRNQRAHFEAQEFAAPALRESTLPRPRIDPTGKLPW